MDASLERAEDLLLIIDQDGNGELDFDEFCTFFVMIKRGDERLVDFQELLEKIHRTPLGSLEHQAQLRELEMKFVTIEEREATALHPAIYVVEVYFMHCLHFMYFMYCINCHFLCSYI